MQVAQPELRLDDQASPALGRIRGHSQALEKSYFRLTAAPDLNTVRPPPVLKLALKRVQQHWVQVGLSHCISDAVQVNSRCMSFHKAPFQPSASKVLCSWEKIQVFINQDGPQQQHVHQQLMNIGFSAVCMMAYDGYKRCQLTCCECARMQTTSMLVST